MLKAFNTTGVCIPERHYMVDITERLRKIKEQDGMLEPMDKNENAYILEFKVFNPRKERKLEDTVLNALDQIQEKDYDRELLARGIDPGKIYHYGFAFQGKNVLIG